MRTEPEREGKYDEYGNRRDVDVAGLSTPPQKIETIDQPRSEPNTSLHIDPATGQTHVLRADNTADGLQGSPWQRPFFAPLHREENYALREAQLHGPRLLRQPHVANRGGHLS